MEPDDQAAPVIRLVGVYHADGTLMGELRYWVGARLGSAHCSLCDITHGLFRAKPEWQRERGCLGLTFDTVHLDERDDMLREATGLVTPCVTAETADGYMTLLGPDELEACHGSVDAMFERLRSRGAELGLALGSAPDEAS
jgi:hypothetical protein